MIHPIISFGNPPGFAGGLTTFDISGNMRKLPSREPLKVYRKESFRMDDYQSLSHTVWDCKRHVGWIPKSRRKTLHEDLRRILGQVFRELAGEGEGGILEGHLMPDQEVEDQRLEQLHMLE